MRLLNRPWWSVRVIIPNSRGQTQAWASIPSTQQATVEVGVRIPDFRAHNKVLDSAYPTQGATRNRGSKYPQLKGPQWRLGIRIPNPGAPTKVWESVSPSQETTPKHGSLYVKLKPGKSVGVPKSWGHTESCKCAQGDTVPTHALLWPLSLGILTPILQCNALSWGYQLPCFGVAPSVGHTSSHTSEWSFPQ